MANRQVGFWIILLVVCTARCTEIGVERENEDGNINHFVDALIPQVVNIIRNENLEPVWLSNFDQNELSDCHLQGLTSVYRSGDCSFRPTDQQQLRIDVRIGFGRLTGSCRISKRVLIFRYRGKIRMRMENVTSTIAIVQNSVDLLANNSRPRLHSLDVQLSNGLGMETEGDSALTFVLDTLKFVYIRRLERLVRDNLREQFRLSLQQYLGQINSWQDVHPSIAIFNSTSTF